MPFDFTTLEPRVHAILEAPGVDLSTISAKRVRKQLLALDPSLSTLLKDSDNKQEVDAVITTVFARVSARHSDEDTDDNDNDDDHADSDEPSRHEPSEDDDVSTAKKPSLPKPRKSSAKAVLDDAALARQLSNEINGRSRRGTAQSRASTTGTTKKSARPKKSAATVDSDDESEDGGVQRTKKPRRKPAAGGTAKGGFAKEYVLSAPLADLLQTEKLSRPQVVKQLWDYIKGNDLQNPSNKREIVCDGLFKAVFNVEKIDMFKMNKVLSQHLHEQE